MKISTKYRLTYFTFEQSSDTPNLHHEDFDSREKAIEKFIEFDEKNEIATITNFV